MHTRGCISSIILSPLRRPIEFKFITQNYVTQNIVIALSNLPVNPLFSVTESAPKGERKVTKKKRSIMTFLKPNKIDTIKFN